MTEGRCHEEEPLALEVGSEREKAGSPTDERGKDGDEAAAGGCVHEAGFLGDAERDAAPSMSRPPASRRPVVDEGRKRRLLEFLLEAPLAERVLRRHEDVIGQLEQRKDRERVILRDRRREGHVDHASPQEPRHLAVRYVAEVWHEARVCTGHFRQRGKDQRWAQRARARHVDRAEELRGLDGLETFMNRPHRVAHGPEKRLAGGVEHDAPARPVEERRSGGVLEQANAPRKRARRDVERLRGAGEMLCSATTRRPEASSRAREGGAHAP